MQQDAYPILLGLVERYFPVDEHPNSGTIKR